MQMDAKNAYRMKLKLKISLKTEKSGMERLRFRETAVLQFENPVGVAPRGAEVMFHRCLLYTSFPRVRAGWSYVQSHLHSR